MVVVNGTIILLMAIAVFVMGYHPDVKQFSESFSSTEEYIIAIDSYWQHPLTKLRTWWVQNYEILRTVFTVSVVMLSVTGFQTWFVTKVKRNA